LSSDDEDAIERAVSQFSVSKFSKRTPGGQKMASKAASTLMGLAMSGSGGSSGSRGSIRRMCLGVSGGGSGSGGSKRVPGAVAAAKRLGASGSASSLGSQGRKSELLRTAAADMRPAAAEEFADLGSSVAEDSGLRAGLSDSGGIAGRSEDEQTYNPLGRKVSAEAPSNAVPERLLVASGSQPPLQGGPATLAGVGIAGATSAAALGLDDGEGVAGNSWDDSGSVASPQMEQPTALMAGGHHDRDRGVVSGVALDSACGGDGGSGGSHSDGDEEDDDAEFGSDDEVPL